MQVQKLQNKWEALPVPQPACTGPQLNPGSRRITDLKPQLVLLSSCGCVLLASRKALGVGERSGVSGADSHLQKTDLSGITAWAY